MSSLERYQYAPLPEGPYIRILTIFPGSLSDLLRGQLKIFNIEQGGDYEPLSYVWEDPRRSHEIVCNDKTLSLTASLEEALRRIRQVNKPRRIWVDQLSINQDDLEERSQQVQFMNMIYKNATRVLVFLGEDRDTEAEAAFQLIRNLNQTFQNKESYGKFRVMNTEQLRDQSEAQWAPLKRLIALPWFTRIWIVQEVGTHAPATLYWGDSECDWDLIWNVARHLSDFHHMRKHFGLRTTDIKYLYKRFVEPDRKGRHANRLSLMYELHRAAHCKLTDPRDRVFAFLGHYAVHEGNPQLAAIRADYTKSVEEIYCDIAERDLLGDPGRTLMALAVVQHPQLPSKAMGKLRARHMADAMPLPSWVPDWREHESHILSEPTSSHNAHAGRPSDLKIDKVAKILKLRGIKLDVLEACSIPIRQKEFHLDKSRRVLAIESLWSEICGKSGFDLKEHYIDDPYGDHAVFAYTQTLSNGGITTASWDARHYHEIDCEEWFAQGAAYLTAALADTDLVSPELKDKAVGGDLYKWTRAANGSASNRSFGRTAQGRYVLGPKKLSQSRIYLSTSIPGSHLADQKRIYKGCEFLAGSPWGFGVETTTHAIGLMASGRFDRHPCLKIILGHCREGLPFSLYRIDDRIRHFQAGLLAE
ncbi:hypothetical protein H2200_012757 [Cladophialophora chaetospira]|uniref:Heterokaryon incompatibility domain-containing protein n=1 Tax=Cladophialophora chaetospira TaxID=386627 RepID=A0AA39CC90_9EURO|nr:hypothetical protein H2200_012757 [Cladophialophora chaetospira]